MYTYIYIYVYIYICIRTYMYIYTAAKSILPPGLGGAWGDGLRWRLIYCEALSDFTQMSRFQ